MFYFRINRLKIVDNRESRGFLQLFSKDRAEVKLNSFITTDQTQLPAVDELLSTRDPHRQKAILSNAVAQVVGSRVLTTIQNVKDGHEMTFGDTGYVLYQSPHIPNDFSWLFIAIESDRDERAIGQEMTAAVHDQGFDSFLTEVVSMAASSVNPSYAATVAIGKFVANTITRRLQHNNDDMIGLLYTSLNRREHYPHGERKRNGVADLTNNMFIDYSLFGFEQPAPNLMQRFPPVAPLRRRDDPRDAA